MRPIDADALERDGWMMHRTVQVDKDTMQYQVKKPTDFSAIELEQKKGKWILHEEIKGFPDWICSECGGSGRGDYHYCPWCMAAME